MKWYRILAIFIALLMLNGCCYASGYSGYAFWEMPDQVPELPLEEYHSGVIHMSGSVSRDPIPDPKVDLESLPVREDSDLVNVLDYIPDISADLRYATADNFTRTVIYEFKDVYLRYGTVIKLMQVQQELRSIGLRLKVWDAFRPVSAQYNLWAAYPNPVYVQNPEKGYSNQSKGNSVDVTLVDAYGNELKMPTKFDDFTGKADRDYSDCSELEAENATILQNVMEKYGFVSDPDEWWHFTDQVDYDVEACIDPAVFAQYYAVCNEYINIRENADVNAKSIGRIPANARFTLLGWSGLFAYVDFGGVRGYVNADFISPV